MLKWVAYPPFDKHPSAHKFAVNCCMLEAAKMMMLGLK
jgi:hypothetical protein